MSTVYVSDRLRVDSVILLVRPDEPNVDDPIRKVDPHDNPVLIPTNIEDDAPVLQDAGTAKLRFHVAWP